MTSSDASSPRPVPAAGPRARHLRVILALMIRDMSSTYGRSVGGYFWSIAQPLGGIVLLAVAFSLALRSPPLGTSFMLFYATGIIPFTMYNAMAGGVAGAITSNRGLLTYPVVTVLDAVLAKLLLTVLTFSVIAAILFAGIIGFFGLHVNLALGPIARGLGMAALLGLGVGAVNCVLFGFFPTWRNVWGVLTRPLFIVSGIFFTFESAPKAFQAVLWWNPLVHIIAGVRTGVYGTYDPRFVSYPYVLGLALGGFVIGGYLMRRHTSFLTER